MNRNERAGGFRQAWCLMPALPLLLGSLDGGVPLARAHEFTVERTPAAAAVVTVDGGPVATYVVDQANKPYLWPVIGPDGKAMTRSFPMQEVEGETTDHYHHRGITFGHENIAGVDTWTEAGTWQKAKPDHPRQLALGSIRHREYRRLEGGNRGLIHAVADMVSHDGKPVLAVEQRFTFAVDGAARIIDADIDLVAAHGPAEVADIKDAGLSIRVPESVRVDSKRGGTIVNSVGQRDAAAWAQRADWVDYHGPIDGGVYGVAMLSHPTTFRHPTPWHVRTYGLFTANPFGIKSLGLAEEPATIRLAAGERLSLRYRFVLHRGDEREAGIAKAWERYAAGMPEPVRAP